MMKVILGCGDVGRRIAKCLMEQGTKQSELTGLVRSGDSAASCAEIGVTAHQFDLDDLHSDLGVCNGAQIYYTVAPQTVGVSDERTARLLRSFTEHKVIPTKAVVISTTGVYGDQSGAWVTEQSPTEPQTERAQRRLHLEHQWFDWGRQNSVPVVMLRVPGIYAYSRLPRARLAKRVPVVRAAECGYTNRIHADDLARVAIAAMQRGANGDVFNVTDGSPGKISEYLQEAARVLGMPPLPEVSMAQAKLQLSPGMLSYLSESRRISNKKMLSELAVTLRYPDYKEGIKN